MNQLRFCLILLLMKFSTAYAEPATTLGWADLIPAEILAELEQLAEIPVDHEAGPAQQSLSPDLSKVVNELDGKLIRLPGFVVPLDSEADVTREFLLVPYYGACLHIPPPPPNQIVHATSDEGIELKDIRLPIWATGVVHVEQSDSELATAGYRMTVANSTAYTVD